MNNDNLKKTITKFVTMAILEADELPFVETAEYVAERLIAAGFKFDSNISFTATFNNEQIERNNELERRLAKAEHRAEVAERALYNACTALSKAVWSILDNWERYVSIYIDAYMEEAEKELSEERKDD